MMHPLLPFSQTATHRGTLRRAAPAPRPCPRRGAAREPLTAAKARELRLRMAAGEFDTPAHAQALAWVLLEAGALRG